MPDIVLEGLGQMLSDTQFEIAQPLQVMCNILASIHKKDGDIRMVAIAATYYRLLTALDNQEIAEFELAHAHANDSAKAGASAIRVAEERALEGELVVEEGLQVFPMLLDFTTLFDSINIHLLFH
mgnify:CR=1 FL=1